MNNFQSILTRISANDPNLTEVDLSLVKLKESIGLEPVEPIDNQSIKDLAEALTKNTHLKKLDLKGNDIEDEGLEALALALEHHPGLTDLDLRLNLITYKGIQALEKALTKNQLQSFYIEYDADDAKEITALATILKNNPNISSLGISVGSTKNKLETKDLKILLEALEANQALDTLDLSGNRIDDEGVKLLLAFIKTRPIKYLNLSYNKISDEGTLLLAATLSEMPTLTTLGLENMAITEIGAKAINELLEKNTNLKNLDFWFPLGQQKRSEQPKHNEVPEPEPESESEPPVQPTPQKEPSSLDTLWAWLGQLLNKVRNLFYSLFNSKKYEKTHTPIQHSTEPPKEAPSHIKQNAVLAEKLAEINKDPTLEKNSKSKNK